MTACRKMRIMESHEATDQFLTIDEAAAVLRVHRSTVYRAIQAGRLHASRDGDRQLIAAAELAQIPAGELARIYGGELVPFWPSSPGATITPRVENGAIVLEIRITAKPAEGAADANKTGRAPI